MNSKKVSDLLIKLQKLTPDFDRNMSYQEGYHDGMKEAIEQIKTANLCSVREAKPQGWEERFATECWFGQEGHRDIRKVIEYFSSLKSEWEKWAVREYIFYEKCEAEKLAKKYLKEFGIEEGKENGNG